jgi:transketolase
MMRLADHLGRALADAASGDARLFVLDGDLADSDGAIHFAERHPERFLMAGIAEQNMVSVAAGLASCGEKPWVFSFAAFLCYRAYDQVRVGISQARQPVVLVGSHAGGQTGRNGKTHGALNDLALMSSLPGLHVWSPGDVADVELAVHTLAAQPVPAYVRLPRRPVAERLPGIAAPSRWLRERAPVTLVSMGIASHWAIAAADALATMGIEVGVLHVARLTPLPSLAQQLAGVEQLFVVEDHYTFGGLATQLQRLGLASPLTAFGWPDDFAGKSGGDDEVRARYGLSAAALAGAIQSALSRPSVASVRR